MYTYEKKHPIKYYTPLLDGSIKCCGRSSFDSLDCTVSVKLNLPFRRLLFGF